MSRASRQESRIRRGREADEAFDRIMTEAIREARNRASLKHLVADLEFDPEEHDASGA